MRTKSELLYWHKYRHMIHYDKKKKCYYYDADIPERAKKSFKAWKKQFK